jgi:hypothetical protein
MPPVVAVKKPLYEAKLRELPITYLGCTNQAIRCALTIRHFSDAMNRDLLSQVRAGR